MAKRGRKRGSSRSRAKQGKSMAKRGEAGSVTRQVQVQGKARQVHAGQSGKAGGKARQVQGSEAGGEAGAPSGSCMLHHRYFLALYMLVFFTYSIVPPLF